MRNAAETRPTVQPRPTLAQRLDGRLDGAQARLNSVQPARLDEVLDGWLDGAVFSSWQPRSVQPSNTPHVCACGRSRVWARAGAGAYPLPRTRAGARDACTRRPRLDGWTVGRKGKGDGMKTKGGDGGSLRSVMPQTAAWIDWLRAELGQEVVADILRRAKAGKAVGYFAEVGPDGVLREWGTPAPGRRAQLVEGNVHLGGSSPGYPGAGNSSRRVSPVAGRSECEHRGVYRHER